MVRCSPWSKGKVALRSLRIPGPRVSPASFRDRTGKASGPRALPQTRHPPAPRIADARRGGERAGPSHWPLFSSSPGGHARFDSGLSPDSIARPAGRIRCPEHRAENSQTVPRSMDVLEATWAFICRLGGQQTLHPAGSRAAGSFLHRQIAPSRASSRVASGKNDVEASS